MREYRSLEHGVRDLAKSCGRLPYYRKCVTCDSTKGEFGPSSDLRVTSVFGNLLNYNDPEDESHSLTLAVAWNGIERMNLTMGKYVSRVVSEQTARLGLNEAAF